MHIATGFFSLFALQAKVTFVRDDDNEYDVQYEDGTIFTIKAKDVKASRSMGSASAGRKKTPSRSRSRGRSPGRRASKATPRTPKKSPARPSTSSAATKAPRPDPTPTRTSARLAAAKVDLSSDEEGSGRSRRSAKAVPNPAHPRKARRGFLPDVNLDWLLSLFHLFLGPAVLLSMHTLADRGEYRLKWPELSRKPADYWDRDCFLVVLGFMMMMRLLNFLPVGSRVRAASGHEVRMNGESYFLGGRYTF